MMGTGPPEKEHLERANGGEELEAYAVGDEALDMHGIAYDALGNAHKVHVHADKMRDHTALIAIICGNYSATPRLCETRLRNVSLKC
jgi:hypothetical protein